MNEITVFRNREFGDVRTVVIDGQPWFVGIDVAKALGYKKPSDAVINNVQKDDSIKVGVTDSLGRSQDTIAINESGLYDLIFESRLQSAKKFRRWVTSEALPQIRQTGFYRKTDSYMIEDPVERAKRWIEEQEERKLLEEKVKEQKPKADYFDSLVDNRLLTTFRDCAKEFSIKPKAFTNWLRENGYIYNDKHNMIKPYAQYVKSGLFTMKDFASPHGYSNVQTYITVKGKETFRLLIGAKL